MPLTDLSATANAAPSMVHDKKTKNRNAVTMLGGGGQICLERVRGMYCTVGDYYGGDTSTFGQYGVGIDYLAEVAKQGAYLSLSALPEVSRYVEP